MNTFRVLKKSTFQNITGMAIINKWVENYIMSITDLAQVWNSKHIPSLFTAVSYTATRVWASC